MMCRSRRDVALTTSNGRRRFGNLERYRTSLKVPGSRRLTFERPWPWCFIMKSRAVSLLDLLQSVAIIAGLSYGALELSQFRSEQHRKAKVEMAQSFLNPEVMRAFAFVLSMPDSMSFERLQAEYPAELPGVMLMSQTFETVGILVHDGDIELEMVDDFLGTPIVATWDKLSPTWIRYREELDAPSVLEWYQWLAERLKNYRATVAPAPAYKAYRDWTPPR